MADGPFRSGPGPLGYPALFDSPSYIGPLNPAREDGAGSGTHCGEEIDQRVVRPWLDRPGILAVDDRPCSAVPVLGECVRCGIALCWHSAHDVDVAAR